MSKDIPKCVYCSADCVKGIHFFVEDKHYCCACGFDMSRIQDLKDQIKYIRKSLNAKLKWINK